MHRRASLHDIIGSILLVVSVSVAATANAQRTAPIPVADPETGSGEFAATTPVPHAWPAGVVIPDSSRALPADRGKKAHTNVRFINPSNSPNPLFPPPYSGYPYETPGSLACVYALATSTPACNPLTTSLPVVSGGSQKIAIVDAYDDPEAAADLDYFSSQFGLPFSVGQFQVVYVGGVTPSIDYTGGWELEESLDIEMAHAMAPKATIYLVEATNNELTSLQLGVQEAINIIQCGNFTTTPMACGGSPTGKGEISMSWGTGEFSSETSLDATFATANSAGVVFLAAAGDQPGPIYPSTSPYVISVGGSTISRSLTTGNYQAEIGWDDGGGGRSTVEAEPTFQSSIPAVHAIANGKRATPDVVAEANPYTGVYVYDTFPMDYYYYGSWYIVGGTSASTPIWAGLLNLADTAGTFPANTQAELTKLYTDSTTPSTYAAAFRDINYGYCNYYMANHAGTNFDPCTGLGSPKSKNGK